MLIVRHVAWHVLATTALSLAYVSPTRAVTACEGPTHAGIKEIGIARAFRSPRLDVDADGAPNAYRLDGKGLSYTCDGVSALGRGFI